MQINKEISMWIAILLLYCFIAFRYCVET